MWSQANWLTAVFQNPLQKKKIDVFPQNDALFLEEPQYDKKTKHLSNN